jgi:hypothetical protein
MSGGVEESYALSEIRSVIKHNSSNSSDIAQTIDNKTFWDILDHAERKSSVIGCNIDVCMFLVFLDLFSY